MREEWVGYMRHGQVFRPGMDPELRDGHSSLLTKVGAREVAAVAHRLREELVKADLGVMITDTGSPETEATKRVLRGPVALARGELGMVIDGDLCWILSPSDKEVIEALQAKVKSKMESAKRRAADAGRVLGEWRRREIAARVRGQAAEPAKWVLYQNMIRIWFVAFIPATLLGAAGTALIGLALAHPRGDQVQIFGFAVVGAAIFTAALLYGSKPSLGVND